MSHILYVGIDVSSSSNSACLMSDTGSVIAKFSFSNDLIGSESFVETLVHHLKSNGYQKIKIATESTSFYDFSPDAQT
jgi:activator of 2-hydroxyglutaryl-CoA dehydratase